MRNLDIAFCFGVLLLLLYAVWASQVFWNVPPADPGEEVWIGDIGPPPQFDDIELVGLDYSAPRSGTVFSISYRGHWLTAKSNLRNCENPAIEVEAGYYLPTSVVAHSKKENLSILKSEPISDGIILAQPDKLTANALGFLVGYPKGRAGEIAVKLLTPPYRTKAKPAQNLLPVISWAETGRTQDLWGDLQGINGAPVISSNGEVVGVVIGHSRRRGRFYSTGLAGVLSMLEEEAILPRGEAISPMTLTNYDLEADKIRRTNQVTALVCLP